MDPVADDHDAKRVLRVVGLFQLQHVPDVDQGDVLVGQAEILPVLHRVDLFPAQGQAPVDPGQGEGIGLPGDLHDKRADHRQGQGQFQVEAEPFAGPGDGPDDAPHLVDHAVDHVQPHAPAGNFGDLVPGGKAGQEQEFHEFRLGQLVEHLGAGEALAEDFGPEVVQVDPPAVVGDGDHQHPRPVGRLQPEGSGFGLPRRGPGLGGLDAVIQGVAQQVAQGGFQLLQDVPVHLGGLAHDIEPDLFPQLPGQVPHHPRKGLDAVGEGPHPDADNLVVKAVREVFRGAGEPFQPVDPAHQLLTAIPGPLPGLVDGMADLGVRVPRLRHLLEPLQGRKEFRMVFLQGHQGIVEGGQPPDGHHHLAGQRHEALDLAGGHPDHPVRPGRLFAFPPGFRRRGRRRPGPRLRSVRRFFLRRRGRRGFGGRLGFRRRRRFVRNRFGRRFRRGSRWGRFRRFRRPSPGRGAVRLARGMDPDDGGGQIVDLLLMAGKPVLVAVPGGVGDPVEHIHALQEHVHRLGGEGEFSLLGGDEAVLHGVGQLDRRIQFHDPRAPLDGVGRPHQGLDGIRRARIVFQGQESLVEGGGVHLHLGPEQVEHGEVAQVRAAAVDHWTLRVRL